MSRRELMATGVAAALTASMASPVWAQGAAMITRTIAHSGEKLPVIGLGTPLILDYASDAAKQAQMTDVIAALIAGGGRVIDTANGYGKGEARLGEIIAELKARKQIFLATKYSSLDTPEAQKASVHNSWTLLGGQTLDLFFAWGVRDDSFDFGYLRSLKSDGTTRYIGIASGRNPDLAALETLIRREKPDFMHFPYSIGQREAEARLFPAAQDAGCGIVATLPFGGSSLFSKVAGKALPDWAGAFGISSWGQFFLKFVLANPAVVTVVPGTNKVANLNDNLGAGHGAVLTAVQRQKMLDYWASVA